MMTHAELEQRVIELEARFSFQELAINELSDALAHSRLETQRHAELLRRSVEDLKSIRGFMYPDPGSEPPPPHY